MASSAQSVSQDIVGGRAWNIANGIGDRNGVTFSGSSSSGGSGSSSRSSQFQFDDYFDKYAAMIKENAAQNNAWSAQQAQLNRDWQERMLNANNNFNAQEAQKNRDWQAQQSATAHQREVKDLLAAGLNPVLSAMNGNGASVTSGAAASSGSAPSGAVGQTDTSANSAMTSLLGAIMSSMVQQENARLSAQTNLAVAEKYNAMSKYTAELGASTELTKTNIQTAASKWIAELQAKTSISNTQAQTATSKIVASIQAAAQRYGYNLSSWTQTQVASLNAQVNKELKQMGIDADFSMQDTDLAWKGEHPSSLDQMTAWNADELKNKASGWLSGLLGDSGFSGFGSSSAKSFSDGSRGGGFSK